MDAANKTEYNFVLVQTQCNFINGCVFMPEFVRALPVSVSVFNSSGILTL